MASAWFSDAVSGEPKHRYGPLSMGGCHNYLCDDCGGSVTFG